VGIVRISGFDANTPAQFKNVMNTLIEGGCTRFVYDVRNNPGGEQKSVMAVLSYFLEENDTIMSVVTKDGSTTYYRAEEATYEGEYAACSVKKEEIGMYRQYPITILTNGYTASAGELFTAVLSEYELATLVGENTYGKGVIQTIYDLSELGFSGGLKLTIGYYAPPSGVNYDGKGIAPDIAVVPDESIANKNIYLLTEQEDNQLLAAIEAVLAK
jgi:carboxyl-terminal processing protease